MTVFRCEHCRRAFEAPKAQKLRSGSRHVYCSRRCAGKAKSRRYYKTKAQRVAEKAAYDKAYRAKNLALIKAKKRSYYLRTFDPEKARRERQKRMRWHVEYCRRYYSDPERKAAKVAYDQARRADSYREYADAWKVLLLLEREVRARCPSKYERLRQRGYYDWVNAIKRERRRHEKEQQAG